MIHVSSAHTLLASTSLPQNTMEAGKKNLQHIKKGLKHVQPAVKRSIKLYTEPIFTDEVTIRRGFSSLSFTTSSLHPHPPSQHTRTHSTLSFGIG